MVFFCLRWLVVEWKNLVLRSPCCIHKALDLCHHMSFSLSSNSLISLWRSAISSAKSCRVFRDSRCWSCSCFFWSCLLTWPNAFVFHQRSWFWQFLIQSCVVRSPKGLVASQASSTTSLHPGFLSHMDLKRNWGFFLRWGCLVFKCRMRAQWSEAAMDLWYTLAP